jgi:hypothetical protein
MESEILIVAPSDWRDADAQCAVEALQQSIAGGTEGRPPRVVRPRAIVRQAVATRRVHWVAVPLRPGAERFDRARVSARLLAATRVVLTPAGGAGLPATRPTALLASFAHPRQRAAAALAADPAALAELASALAPSLTIAVARIGERWLAAAANDPVAAELGWLGLAALVGGRSELVAWQDPAVQRLCLLGDFARGPGDIVIAADRSMDAGALRRFTEELGSTPPNESNRNSG